MSTSRILPGRGIERVGMSPAIHSAIELGIDAVETQESWKLRDSGPQSLLYRIIFDERRLTAVFKENSLIPVNTIPVLRRNPDGSVLYMSDPDEPQILTWTAGIPVSPLIEALSRTGDKAEAELLRDNSGQYDGINRYNQDRGFITRSLARRIWRFTGEQDPVKNWQTAESLLDPSIPVLRFKQSG